MNENLDLTKILDGCPEGTELYSSIYGEVRFDSIDLDSNYPIRFSVNNAYYPDASVTKEGIHNRYFDGECVVFPSKDQRDWSKFERFWDKPKKERFDVNTLQPFDKVLVCCDEDNWCVDFFAYKGEKFCICVSGGYDYCIPYNEETKHLIGTKEDCPEYYKWWEYQL